MSSFHPSGSSSFLAMGWDSTGPVAGEGGGRIHVIMLEKNPHLRCPWQPLCTLHSPPSMSCTRGAGLHPHSAHTAENTQNTHCKSDLRQTYCVRSGMPSAKHGTQPGLPPPHTSAARSQRTRSPEGPQQPPTLGTGHSGMPSLGPQSRGCASSTHMALSSGQSASAPRT